VALPETVQFVLTQASLAPPLWEIGLDVARAGEVMWSRMASTEPPVIPTRDECAGDVPVRVYEPDGVDAGIFVFMHGGGWTTGCIETHEWICRRLAIRSQRRVASVEYRLAPEHRFPAALDDCAQAIAWAYNQFGGPLVVGGDSAGGNLAAAVCIRGRDQGGPPISGQVLMYPAVDASCASPSFVENGAGFLLTADLMRWFWAQYTGGGAAPALASVIDTVDLSGLPPAMVIVAGYDPLRDEGLAYAERLRDAGVDVRVEHYPDALHGFLGMDLLFPAETAAAMQAIAEFLQTELGAAIRK
jgi:acetyl esterase